jgi:ligand-binding SRPBCC domain-containing protein
MTYQLIRTQQLNCNLEEAWHFFSSPNNLSKITPKQLSFKVLTNLEGVAIHNGMTIEYKVAPLLGIPLYWQTLITEVDWMKKFTDFQMKGPYKLWKHTHEFTANEQGVLMKDSVDYQLPLGFLGRFAHSLFVKRKLNHIFDFRYTFLENYFNNKK